jgi:UDP-GlcNAc:undecaprenyl-phosphate/decaprenyl-phosphate GlcNAc-1-phosphate transferase
MLSYLGVFLATALAVFVLTPLVRMLARRVGAIVQPSSRMVHVDPVPTMGGLAMLGGVAVGIGVAFAIGAFRPLFHFPSELAGVAIACVVIVIVGVVDDMRNISAPAKVAGQVLAAGLLVLFGVELLFFYFPGQGTISLGSDLAVPLSIAWVLLAVNAVNLIDGLDGLAAGIVIIASVSFFVYAYTTPTIFGEANTAPLLCALAAGAAAGFLPHNFHPAKIIMGDTGAMLLGLLLAAATISSVGQTSDVGLTGHFVAVFSIPVLLPVLVLALPLMDVVLAVVRRLRRGRKWYTPDKEHIHHQLLGVGHTHRQAVLLMYLWSAVVAGATLAITYARNRATAAFVAGFAILVIGVTVVPRVVRAVRRSQAEAQAGRASGS